MQREDNHLYACISALVMRAFQCIWRYARAIHWWQLVVWVIRGVCDSVQDHLDDLPSLSNTLFLRGLCFKGERLQLEFFNAGLSRNGLYHLRQSNSHV